MINIVFNSFKRQYWIENINHQRSRIHKNELQEKEDIFIHFARSLKIDELLPIHIVLLACFIHFLESYNYNVQIEGHTEICEFLKEDVSLFKYFGKEQKAHVESPVFNVLNLWKIVNNQSQGYSISLTNYFSKQYFQGLDLTGFKSSLDEIYINIDDHSQSNGNAFSYISYDETKRFIHIAACDFGLGIPNTLRKVRTDFKDDVTALRNSLEIGVTARTHPHNRGFGLDNIISNLSHGGTLRIVSNKALLFCEENKSNLDTYEIGFNFEGTLIYLDISIDAFEKTEYINDIAL